MSGTVWTKFYWNDWLSDPGLRRSSLAARGLWIDLLCFMAQHDPIGLLAVRGEALSISDVARMTGISETDASTLMGELERNGVFSRDRNGRIYSRRMVRDAKRSSEGRKYKREAMEAKHREKQEKITDLEGGLEAHLQAHMPVANSHEPVASKVVVPRARDPATDAHRLVAMECLDLGSSNLSAWERRFLEDLCAKSSLTARMQTTLDGIATKVGFNAETAMAKWRKRMNFAREIKAWDTPKWGPAPNAAGCRVPRELIEPEDGRGWIEYAHWRPAS